MPPTDCGGGTPCDVNLFDRIIHDLGPGRYGGVAFGVVASIVAVLIIRVFFCGAGKKGYAKNAKKKETQQNAKDVALPNEDTRVLGLKDQNAFEQLCQYLGALREGDYNPPVWTYLIEAKNLASLSNGEHIIWPVQVDEDEHSIKPFRSPQRPKKAEENQNDLTCDFFIGGGCEKTRATVVDSHHVHVMITNLNKPCTLLFLLRFKVPNDDLNQNHQPKTDKCTKDGHHVPRYWKPLNRGLDDTDNKDNKCQTCSAFIQVPKDLLDLIDTFLTCVIDGTQIQKDFIDKFKKSRW